MDLDIDLLESWMDGNAEAGQALVRRHYKTVFSFFHSRLDPDASADLTQATFETLCKSCERYRGAASFRAYLLGIARWKLVAFYRRTTGRQEQLIDGEGAFVPEVSDRSNTSIWSARERGARVVVALRRLTLDEQLLLELKEYEGFTAREISEALAIPPGTVATRLRKARRLLTEHLAELSDTGLADLTATTLREHLDKVRASFGEPVMG